MYLPTPLFLKVSVGPIHRWCSFSESCFSDARRGHVHAMDCIKGLYTNCSDIALSDCFEMVQCRFELLVSVILLCDFY